MVVLSAGVATARWRVGDAPPAPGLGVAARSVDEVAPGLLSWPPRLDRSPAVGHPGMADPPLRSPSLPVRLPKRAGVAVVRARRATVAEPEPAGAAMVAPRGFAAAVLDGAAARWRARLGPPDRARTRRRSSARMAAREAGRRVLLEAPALGVARAESPCGAFVVEGSLAVVGTDARPATRTALKPAARSASGPGTDRARARGLVPVHRATSEISATASRKFRGSGAASAGAPSEPSARAAGVGCPREMAAFSQKRPCVTPTRRRRITRTRTPDDSHLRRRRRPG